MPDFIFPTYGANWCMELSLPLKQPSHRALLIPASLLETVAKDKRSWLGIRKTLSQEWMSIELLLCYLIEAEKLLNRPDVIGDSCLHRWGYAQGLMHSAEIVMGRVKRQCRLQIFPLFRETVREPHQP